MAPLSIIGALSALHLALAHMQMSSPSPLRDPHADRPNEPKDYNILSPLNADGSNFACKGYHLNTPLTTVATYTAGSKQTLRLKGSATHGGGSCQISLSCDGGSNFQVIKSIIGGCPLSDNYDFTVPSDIPSAKKCLLAWTWFNRIGNREMYMNCAVVDITNKSKGKRDSQASAAQALSRYPDLFVANLANINNCKIPETTDVIFDTPGKQVSFGNGDSASMRPSFGKGQCTGKGSKSADSKDTSSNNSGGQWAPPVQTTPQQSGGQNSGGAPNCNDGFYHATGCWGDSRAGQQQDSQVAEQEQQQPSQPQTQHPQQPQQQPTNSQVKKPNTKVQQELDAYLATLYGRGVARRNMVPAAGYAESYNQKEMHPTQPTISHKHTHTEGCKHIPNSYSPDPHYHNEEAVEPYSQGGIDYSDENEYSSDGSAAYKRASRRKRWTSYNKRADGAPTPIQFHRGDDSAAIQQASTPTPTPPQTSDDPPAQKSYYEMTPAEQFEAFLRRMVELSNNMASLIKYAAASTVNVPYYPSASANDRPDASSPGTVQKVDAVGRRAKRGVLSSADAPLTQVYPGPSIGRISAPGDATDAEEGFKAWFPDLVQGLVKKRQLVDPVTSKASSDAGDSVNIFDALLSQFLKAFGDPFHIFGDDSEFGDDSGADPVPPEPLPLGDPPTVNYPDFEIPDLDGHYTFPPQILAPEPPTPQLLPGYELGPDGPIWTGEGPDPIGNDFDSTPSNTSDPTEIYPGEDIPILSSCVEPIPQVGFNSCWGGCNHTAEEIAAHDVYLQNFAEEEARYEECLKQQALDASTPVEPQHGIYPVFTERPFDDANPIHEAPDASGRRPRPRPGHSHPLIPYPLPANFTGPFPSNSSNNGPSQFVSATSSVANQTEFQPYQNKTLGEIVSEIMKTSKPLSSSPVADTPEEPISTADANGTSNSSDNLPLMDQPSQETNPLQEAADQAEEGVTIPQEPVEIDPNALKTIADALPWLMGPGPVITNINQESGTPEGA